MSLVTPKLFSLQENSRLTLRDQICEAVSSAISTRSIPFDRPLPSCRELANQLNVSRNTVFSAYSRLIDLGILVSRDRSGYFVNTEAQIVFANTDRIAAAKAEATPSPLSLPPSGMTPIDNPTDWAEYPFPFLYNQIDPNLFPVDAWRECSRQVLGRKEMPFWAGDAVENDSPQLVQQLRERLLSYRGIAAGRDEILITLGAQNALFLVSTLFARRKLPVAFEDPSFQGARNAFQLAGHELIGVPVDEKGIRTCQIPEHCQLVFTTPSHQFPTMVTMSQDRREALLRAAADRDFMIIEDDYEAEMNFFSNSSPSLRSMDRNERVIYIGSLSKTVSPGIRIGFIVAHADIIREIRAIRGAILRHPPTLVQETAALFFRLGYFDAHLRNIQRRFKRRWHTMRSAIVRHLDMLHVTENEGGTSFWLTGPKGFDATKLRKRLIPRGVLIDRGQIFYLKNDDRRSFRVGFAYVPVDKLEDGVKIIAEEAKKLI